MNLDEQYEFVEKQLTVSAESVGIFLRDSADALICLWCYSSDHDRSLTLSDYCNEQEYSEASRLLKKFKTKLGHILLFYLGEACLFRSGKTGYGRVWEEDDKAEHCRFSRGRAFCDFAMSVGHVAHLCEEYARGERPSKSGGRARAEKYRKETEKAVALFRSMSGLENMSADEAAGHILGKVDLCFRKISDAIRTAKKHDAKHNAHDA